MVGLPPACAISIKNPLGVSLRAHGGDKNLILQHYSLR